MAFAKDAKVLFIKGELKINGVPAKKRQLFSYGDKIETSEKTLAILSLKPGVIMKIKENTSFVASPPKKVKGKDNYSYILKAGDMFIKAQAKPGREYKVVSKSVAMAVRGTQFFVSKNPEKKDEIWMCVKEGKVEISYKKNPKKVMVKAGEGVFIDSKKLPTPKKYAWTQKLNWNLSGKYKDIKPVVDTKSLMYDVDSFEYQ